MFWKKNHDLDEIEAIKRQFETLKLKLNLLETDVSSLRAQLNRKIGGKKPEETEKLNSSVLLPIDGFDK